MLRDEAIVMQERDEGVLTAVSILQSLLTEIN